MIEAISINRMDEINQEVVEILDAVAALIADRVQSASPRARRIILATAIENCLEDLQRAKALLLDGVL